MGEEYTTPCIVRVILDLSSVEKDDKGNFVIKIDGEDRVVEHPDVEVAGYESYSGEPIQNIYNRALARFDGTKGIKSVRIV